MGVCVRFCIDAGVFFYARNHDIKVPWLLQVVARNFRKVSLRMPSRREILGAEIHIGGSLL